MLSLICGLTFCYREVSRPLAAANFFPSFRVLTHVHGKKNDDRCMRLQHQLLGWPKILFGFHKLLQKNPNQHFGSPNMLSDWR